MAPFKKFLPLIAILSIIIIATIIYARLTGDISFINLMNTFMGMFFLTFGAFKLYNLQGFAEAYSSYDLIAHESLTYAYAYPFIEVGLGIAYLLKWEPKLISLITLLLMLIGALGVWIELRKNRPIMCACLGVVFKLPMTYVTLAEDLLMAAMAAWMLLR